MVVFVSSHGWNSNRPLGRIYESVTLGTAIRAPVVLTDSDYRSAQRQSWRVTPFTRRYLSSWLSYNPDGVSLGRPAIYDPLLGFNNITPQAGHPSHLVLQHGPVRDFTIEAPRPPPPELLKGKGNGKNNLSYLVYADANQAQPPCSGRHGKPTIYGRPEEPRPKATRRI